MMNDQIIVEINECIHRLTCNFNDDVSEELFEAISELKELPGYDVKYGSNKSRGGLDASIVEIKYNKAKAAYPVAMLVNAVLKSLGFDCILWKRLINYGCRTSNNINDIFDDHAKVFPKKTKEASKNKNVSTTPFEVWFESREVALRVASYFTSTSVYLCQDKNGKTYHAIKSFLLTEDTLLRILRENNLRTDSYLYREPNAASRALKIAITELIAKMDAEMN